MNTCRRGLAADIGDDIELKSVQLQFPATRTLDKNASLYKVRVRVSNFVLFKLLAVLV